jgi:hypothetical protein
MNDFLLTAVEKKEALESMQKLVFTDMDTYAGEIKRLIDWLEKEKNHPDIKKLERKYGKKRIQELAGEAYEKIWSDNLDDATTNIMHYLRSRLKELKENDYVFREEITFSGIVLILFFLSLPFISEELSKEERVLLKGSCIDSLSNERFSHIVTFLDYHRGITVQDTKRMQNQECSDEYLIYSRKNKRLYRTNHVPNDSFWSLLVNMLPETMLEAIEKHPHSKKYLSVSRYAGSSYNKRMFRERREKEYLELAIYHKIHTAFGFGTSRQFFIDCVKRDDNDSAVEENARTATKEMSRIRRKYNIK